MEMARCLMQSKKLHYMYSAEAIKIANYILNRCSTSAVDGKTPYEAWYDKKPTVRHFRVFGCLEYAHVPKEHRKKLDAKSEPCVFIGYSDESKAYRLYNPKTKKTLVSWDVIFEEGKVYGQQQKCIVDIGGDVTSHEDTSQAKNVQPKRLNSLPNLQVVPPSPPSSPSQSSKSTPSSPSSGGSPNVIQEVMKTKRGKRHFQNHPPSQVLDPNFHQILTRSQFHEMEKFVKQFSNMELDEDPKGEMVNYALCAAQNTNISIFYPSCYEEACTKNVWVKAMQEELHSIDKNDTWELCELPKGKRCVGSKWVYKTKYNSDGTIERHKARLVAKGFTQKHGVDFEETFAPVAR